MEETTRLLLECQNGQTRAVEKLYPIIYDELRKIAHRQLGNAWAIDTICTTALVNEAYLKLNGLENAKAKNRTHFLAIAAKAMRQIILNYAEKKRSVKRGGEWHRVTGLDDFDGIEQHTQNFETLISINEALIELENIDQNLCQLIELRFYAGLTEDELAQFFDVSIRTIRRNWKKAKALIANVMQ